MGSVPLPGRGLGERCRIYCIWLLEYALGNVKFCADQTDQVAFLTHNALLGVSLHEYPDFTC